MRVLARSKVTWSPPHLADIVSIGSVLEPWFWKPDASSSFQGVIWGSGRMYGEEAFSVPPDRVALVRGPSTLRTLDGMARRTIPLGDPGLLADMFVTRTTKKYSLGLIPHWSQVNHPIWKEIASQRRHVQLIHPLSGYERVVNEIAQCDAIASSSLHGLIVADALGVPSIWVKLEDEATANEANARFKFDDYYASTGRENLTPVLLSAATSSVALAQMAWKQGPSQVRHIQNRVLESFPL